MLKRNLTYRLAYIFITLFISGYGLASTNEQNKEDLNFNSLKWKFGVGAGFGIFDTAPFFDPRKEDLTFGSLDLKSYENINRLALLLNCSLGVSKTITIDFHYSHTSLPSEVVRDYGIDELDTTVSSSHIHRFLISYSSLNIRYNTINNSSIIPYCDIGITNCHGCFDLLDYTDIYIQGKNIKINENFRWTKYDKIGCNFAIGANYLINRRIVVFSELRAYLIGQTALTLGNKHILVNNDGVRFIVGLKYFLH
jgi:hypothetical protein